LNADDVIGGVRKANPWKEGTKGHGYYAKYRGGMTVAEAVKAGVPRRLRRLGRGARVHHGQIERGAREMSNLRDRVFEALQNAVDNGYGNFVFVADPDEVAADLCDCCADLEDEDPGNLVPFVQEWRARTKSEG
jgi:hypothetical protein